MNKNYLLKLTLNLAIATLPALAFAAKPPFAESYCFSDMTSFLKVRSHLPQALQGGQFYATRDSWDVTGGVRIKNDGFHFFMDAHLDPLVGSTIDDKNDQLDRVCAQGNDVSMHLSESAKKPEVITITDAQTVRIRGRNFKLTNVDGYVSIISKVPGVQVKNSRGDVAQAF